MSKLKPTNTAETGEIEETPQPVPSGSGTEQAPPGPSDPRADVRIYLGPTMHRRAIVEATVYRGGLNAHVSGLIAKIPEIAAMIVPLSEVVAAKRRIKEPGTTEYGIYRYLLAIRFDENGEVRA
jgi:hypothetical protein